MDQMILCAMAMVALRWWTSVAPWGTEKECVYDLVAYEGHPYFGAWPRA
jgi:hypothetical protein